MFALIVVVLAITGSGESKRAGHHCHKMELKQLCSTEGEECRDRMPDYSVVCKHYRRSTDVKNTTILSSDIVPYWDASAPVILELTGNQTVAPGEPFEIRCLAEGAPFPHVVIDYREDADLTPIEDGMNSVDIVKRVIQASTGQRSAIYEDEGWYRCVAINGLGVVFEDTYLTIASEEDICATIACSGGLICTVDEITGEPGCICPFCTGEDYENDAVLYCGTDCGVYLGKCQIYEQSCQSGRDVDVFSKGLCDIFAPSTYSYEEPADTELDWGSVVQLTCRGAAATGPDAGPDPIIQWYIDWGDDMGGRELIGEGSVLSYRMEFGSVDIVCVGVHCHASHDMKQDTDINHFRLAIPGLHTTPPTTGTATPTTRYTSPDEPITFPKTTDPYQPFTTESLPVAHGGKACQIMGDPFISTFDNRWYKQDGVCQYVLAMDCRMAQWFVYGKFSLFGTYTSLESVTVYSGYSVLELQRGWLVNNNGEKLRVKLGEETPFGPFTYSFDGEFLTLKFGEENEIRWNGFNGVQILISPNTPICGLCGNNNDDSSDDFQARRRGMVDQPYDFVKSWGLRIQEACYNNEQEVEPSDEGKEACSALFFNKYIIKCHDTVPVEEYELACARSYDTNEYEGWRAECNVLQSYILQCQTRGYNLSHWRERTQCTVVEEVQKFTLANGCPQDFPPV